MRAELHHKASLPVRVPRGIQGFWDIICALAATQGHFTITDIDGESNVDRQEIKVYVRLLTKAGFLAVEKPSVDTGHGRTPTVYRLARKQRYAPRVRADGSLIYATAQEHLWTTIRNLKTFGLAELKFGATTGDVKPSYAATRVFVLRLVTAGYLTRVSRGVFRLKPGMDTGPQPPERRALRAKVMWDPNRKKFVGEPPLAKEVLP